MPAQPTMLVLGYFTGSDASRASALSAPVNVVSMDVITVAADGNLSGSLPTDLLASLSAMGKVSYACISNFGVTDFDPAIAHGAIVTNRARTIANIVALSKTPHLEGINLDFEGLYVNDRDAYSSFVADLATQLHGSGTKLILSIPAKSVDDPSNDWSWPYDYAALGKSADFLQVMTYDEHVPSQPAGPVAGIDWMQASLKFAASQVSPSKLLSGLPAYGYVWNLTRGGGDTVAWKDFQSYVAATGQISQWDPTSQSAWVKYTGTDGSQLQMWFETPMGIQAKVSVVQRMNLAGLSVWALGMEDSAFWNAVRAGK